THPATEHGVEHRQRVPTLIVSARSPHTQHEVRLFGVVFVQHGPYRTTEPRLPAPRRSWCVRTGQSTAQRRFHHAHHRAVFDVARHRQHHPLQSITPAVETTQRRRGHHRDGLFSAQDRTDRKSTRLNSSHVKISY